jgi:hypothetical protein
MNLTLINSTGNLQTLISGTSIGLSFFLLKSDSCKRDGRKAAGRQP